MLVFEREGELTRLVDTLASRLRARGHRVPGGTASAGDRASIARAQAGDDRATRLRGLAEDMGHVVAACRTAHAVAVTVDANTADRLAGQIRALEKGWMLSAQAGVR